MRRIARLLCAAALAACIVAGSASAAAAALAPVKPGSADPTQFPQSLQCVCHRMLLNDWQESMHSQALDDPLFKAKVDEADKASGGKFGVFCRRCHAPVANMTSQDGTDSMTPAAAQGVVCSFCHQVAGLSKPLANVPHLLDLTGVMRAQLKDAKSPHFTRYSPLHRTSKICGGCHNVDHPGNGLHLETTYTEWEKSPQAKKGIQCQDCHMSETPPTIGPSTGFAAEAAPERPNIYRMTFAGAQVGLGNARRATALLKSAAKVEMESPDVVSADRPGEVKVKVTNVGAGHYLPTGLTDVRQMWLSVVTIDGAGKETEVGRRDFGTQFKDSKGNYPVEVQDAVGVGKDDRIPPMKSITQTFTVTLPAGVAAAELKAQLLYKSVPDELAKRAGVANPTTTMAEASKRVFATEAARAADATIPPAAESSGGAAPGSPPLAVPALICTGMVLIAAGGIIALIVRARRSGKR